MYVFQHAVLAALCGTDNRLHHLVYLFQHAVLAALCGTDGGHVTFLYLFQHMVLSALYGTDGGHVTFCIYFNIWYWQLCVVRMVVMSPFVYISTYGTGSSVYMVPAALCGTDGGHVTFCIYFNIWYRHTFKARRFEEINNEMNKHVDQI